MQSALPKPGHGLCRAGFSSAQQQRLVAAGGSLDASRITHRAPQQGRALGLPRLAPAARPLRPQLRTSRQRGGAGPRHAENPDSNKEFHPSFEALHPEPAASGSSGSTDAKNDPTLSYMSDSELEEEAAAPSSSSRPAAATSAAAAAGAAAEGPSSPLKRVLQLPLEAATALSKEDAHYLEKRGRSRWWKRSQFPRVPADSMGDVARRPPELQIWKKVLPLGLIFFVASFNLTILQNLKDAIMVTTAGAETLPFLASFVVLPASLGFFMLYGKMVESLPQKAVFYTALAPLVGFYIAFTALLYPIHGSLHFQGFYAATAPLVPAGLHGLLKVIEYWTFSLFFCASELWGSVVISVLFWSLANEVCTVSEAKTVYPLMGIAANVALVLAGSWVKWVNSSLAQGSTQVMLNWLVGGIVALTGVMMAAKWALDSWCVGDYCAIDEQAQKPGAKKKKSKGSLGESFAVIRSSPKIKNLALLVMSYGVSHRLFEFAWKGQLRALYPTPAAYQSVLADVSIATGWCTIALMLFGKFVFQYLGWGAAAAATPTIMLAAGVGFFGLTLAANQGISVMGMDPAAMAVAGVMAGAVTQVFARSSKFSLFDPAKEMVYIEMSREEKSKGKAAVDLLGSQIGKSGGAWLTQALLLVLGSISASMPVIAAAFTGVILSWLQAVMSLGKQLKDYEQQKSAAKVAQAAAAAEGADAASANGSSANGSSNGVGPDATPASPVVSPQAA